MDLAYGEDGRLVPSEEFDYSALDQDLFERDPQAEASQFTEEEIDRALQVLRVMLQWIWQSGMKNVDGVKIRSIVMCWIFLKELRPLTLTQLSRGFGLKKQSVGRWVDEFKRDFPQIKTAHMRNLSQ